MPNVEFSLKVDIHYCSWIPERNGPWWLPGRIWTKIIRAKESNPWAGRWLAWGLGTLLHALPLLHIRGHAQLFIFFVEWIKGLFDHEFAVP
jgi:hypothetical protein